MKTIPLGLLVPPKLPSSRYVRPVLLGGARHFFKAEAETEQLMPEGIDAHRHAEVRQATLLQLGHADVRLAAYPVGDHSTVLLKPRAPVTPDLLGPKLTAAFKLTVQARHRPAAHAKALAHLDRTGSCLPGLDDPTPQILA